MTLHTLGTLALAQTWFATLSLCCLSSRNTTAIVTFAKEVAPGRAHFSYLL